MLFVRKLHSIRILREDELLVLKIENGKLVFNLWGFTEYTRAPLYKATYCFEDLRIESTYIIGRLVVCWMCQQNIYTVSVRKQNYHEHH